MSEYIYLFNSITVLSKLYHWSTYYATCCQ